MNAKTVLLDFKEHGESRNYTTTKGHNNFPVTNLKDLQSCCSSVKDLKIVVLRKLSEL